MEWFRQKQINLDILTQPGSGEAANYFRESNEMYGNNQSKVPAVSQSQWEDDATCSVPTTFGEQMETIDTVPRKLQMPQVVLATVPGYGWNRNRTVATVLPHEKPGPLAFGPVSTSKPGLCKPRLLAPIKYLSSDRIMT